MELATSPSASRRRLIRGRQLTHTSIPPTTARCEYRAWRPSRTRRRGTAKRKGRAQGEAQAAANTINGLAGADYLKGLGGKDTLSGGSGRDTYDFNAVAKSGAGTGKRAVITDFDHLVDKIDLLGIDADTGLAGNQTFRWVGTSALTGPGEVGYSTGSGITVIRASNDVDLAAEFEIQLTGIKVLSAADFYL